MQNKNGGKSLYSSDKYSVYSSDTEERIVSVDRGLERCAVMLKMLDGGSNDELHTGGLHLQHGGRKQVQGYSKEKQAASKEKPGLDFREGKVLSEKLKKGFRDRLPRNGKSGPMQMNKPECARYQQHHHQQVQPAASSTPTKQGVGGGANRNDRAARMKARNTKESRSCVTPPPMSRGREGMLTVQHHHAGSAEELPHPPLAASEGRGGGKIPPYNHRRQQTEPGKSSRGSGAGGRDGVGFPPSVQSWGDVKMAAERRGGRIKKQEGQGRSVSPPQHPPPPPPPLFHPFCHPYTFPYYPPPPPPPYPFPFYHPPQLPPPPPDWPNTVSGDHTHHPPQQQHHQRRHRTFTFPHASSKYKSEAEALDLATLHHHHHLPYPYSGPSFMDFYHNYYKDMAKFQRIFSKSREQASSKLDPPFPDDSAPEKEDKGGDKVQRAVGVVGGGVGTPAAAVGQDVLSLEGLDDVLKACEERVDHVRTECRSLLVGTKLDGVQQSLQKSRQLLQQNRRRSSSLAGKEKNPQKDLPSELQNDLLSSSSANLTDLLSQIQQMQEERVGLIERIKESCCAYSKVRREMDILEKMRAEDAIELEERRLKMSELQGQLSAITEDFQATVSNLKITKQELMEMKQFSETASIELKMKNASLQQQVHSLLEDVATLKEEKQKATRQLTHLQQTLEASNEDQQALKITLSEKDTHSLHIEDQLLGLRQCLAQFVSKLSRLDPLVQHGVQGTLYCMSAAQVNGLKSLAEDGNIDRFLSGGLSSQLSPSSSTSTLTGIADREEDNDVIKRPPLTEPFQAVISPLHSLSTSVGLSGGGGPRVLPCLQLGTMGRSESKDSSGQTGTTGQTETAFTSSEPFLKPTYSLYPLKASPSFSSSSSPSLISADVKSTVTTSSEIEFRNNLASLDADIARLQMQFKVARQPS